MGGLTRIVCVSWLKFVRLSVLQTSENFIISVNLIQLISNVVEITEEDVITVFKTIDEAGIDIIEILR